MIYAIINQKGGVGKSTTAATLAAGLKKRGYKVLAIDLDSQCNLTFMLQGETDERNALEFMKGTPAEEVLQETYAGHLIAGTSDLANIDGALNAIADKAQRERLLLSKNNLVKKALSKIKSKYDYVIIDTPPTLTTPTINALMAADAVIIPAQADILSLQAINDVSNIIAAVKEDFNEDLTIDGILLTRYKGRTTLAKDIAKAATEQAERINTRVYWQPIKESVVISEAQTMQKSIFDYAKNSGAAADYNAFIDELIKGRPASVMLEYKGKQLAKYSTAGTFAGEFEQVRNKLAEESGIDPREIIIKTK